MAVVVLGCAWPATPALADPARPGNTVSVVESVTPTVTGVMVDIVGGDAFLRLRATPGVEVQVPGYQGEPYLWVRADGSVWRNASSPASELNENRYITASAPEVTTRPGTPLPEPLWEAYGGSGEVLWHDHRVHWMGTSEPPTIDAEGLVQRWEVPIVVDGVDVTVAGSLRRIDGASALWWALAGVVAGAMLLARRRWNAVAGTVAAGLGMFTAAVGFLARAGLPSPARSVPAFEVLALLGVALAAMAAWRSRTVVAGPSLAGAGMALLMVAWLGRGGVTAAIVPGLSTPWPWRLAVVASLGAGAVALVAGAQTASRSRAPVSLEG